MAKWKLSVVAALNSCPSPSGFEMPDSTTACPLTEKQVKNIQQVAPENRPRSSAALVVAHGVPPVVAVRDDDGGAGAEYTHEAANDGQKPLSPDMLRWTERTPSDMELDPEDNPLPPPLGRPGVGPVAAATALQGALELMSIQATRNQPGKYFKPLLSKHIPDHLRCRIWANKYINFQYLIEADPTEEVTYQFVLTNTNNTGLTLTPVKTKAKLDGWVAWNKVMRMFMEIYCMKYPNHCM